MANDLVVTADGTLSGLNLHDGRLIGLFVGEAHLVSVLAEDITGNIWCLCWKVSNGLELPISKKET